MSLLNKDCVKVKSNAPQLQEPDIKEFLKEIPNWIVSYETDPPHLVNQYTFTDFRSALTFVNQVGIESEKQDHHPKIILEWDLVTIEWWTHSIGRLHINDFIMAYRSDLLSQ
ncbi:MAG: 4a-hydroxytetrahydrobiopterin dehydratase [Chloroflexi bacterium]|jgi:4a-hydroxytetrahydrobiopterin dehydratase|nr:MAG: 4a-hydroxytetrahydrobiopterin dehydratase [Chloroflexota bacterium]